MFPDLTINLSILLYRSTSTEIAHHDREEVESTCIQDIHDGALYKHNRMALEPYNITKYRWCDHIISIFEMRHLADLDGSE